MFSARRRRTSLPPLPHHPDRGLRIEAGDTVEAKEFTISLIDSAARDDSSRPYLIRIPPWSSQYKCGATFGLSSRLEPTSGVIDGNRVDIVEDGWSVEV